LETILNRTAANSSEELVAAVSQLFAMLSKQASDSELVSRFQLPVFTIQQCYDFLQQTLSNAAIAGSQNEFIVRELEILSSLASGAAVEHHLEPSYFASLEDIVRKAESRAS
jgi:hypothetical protein